MQAPFYANMRDLAPWGQADTYTELRSQRLMKGVAQEEFAIAMDETTVGRTLRAMGYRKLSARPRHHAQDPERPPLF